VALAALAGRQHGVVALFQLAALGLGGSGVRSRVAAGRLHRVHRGVFAVGHRLLSREGHWMAAVLACGPGSVLSHRSAAALLGLRPSARHDVDVIVPGRSGRVRAGIDVHAAGTLHAVDITIVRGIPCTSVARTLLDLADVVDRRGVERAIEQAEILRILDVRALNDVLDRGKGRRGCAVLRALLGAHRSGATATRSELEERFLRICREAGVTGPRVNAFVALPDGGFEVDFLWPAERLVVETDGRAYHGTRHVFESERERDRRLVLAGWRVVRFTWRQLSEGPGEVTDVVQALLHPERQHP